MSFDAGTAHAAYILSIDQPIQAAAQLKALFAGIAADAAKAGKAAPGGGGVSPTVTSTTNAQARALTALRNSEIAAARAAGDHARALTLIEAELGKASQGTVRYNQLLAQQSRAQAALAKQNGLGPTLPRSLENFGTAAIGQLVGGLGIAAVTSRVIELGKEAFSAANSLEKTEATTAALAGSTARYAEVLKIAKTGQTSYGGSLEENLRGLGSLVNLSNRAGVELSKLDNISRRLAIVDPVQGIEGANIALKEFLSSSGSEAALSLARRFELPRTALAALAKEGISAKDRLAGLDALLNQQGITSQVLSDRTKTTAATYDRLGAAAENAKLRVGGLVAELLKTPAQNLTIALNRPDDVATKKSDLGAGAIAGAENFTQYQIAIQKADRELLNTFGTARGYKVEVDALTEAQFNYIKSLQAQGTSTAEAIAKTRDLQSVFTGLGQASGLWRDTNEQILRIAGSSAVGRAGIESLLAAYNAGTLTFAQLVAALNGLEAQQRRNTVVAQDEEREQRRLSGEYFKTSDAAAKLAQALAETIGKSQTSAIESAKLADVQSRLASLGKDVFSGLITSANGAAALAQQYGFTRLEAERLIEAQTRIAGIANTKRAEVAATGFRQNEISGQFQTQEQLNASILKQVGIDRARQDQVLRTGTATQKIAVLQQRYNDAVRQSGKDSKEAIDAQTALIAEQQAAAKTGGGRVSAAESTALQLQNVEENSQLQLLKTQREGLERLRDQQDDFDLRRVRSQEDEDRKIRRLLASGQIAAAKREREEFAIEQRRAREDFDRERRRTLRNNQEGLGDIGARTDLRQTQIGNRAALRNGGATLGSIPPPTAATGLAGAGGIAGARVIQVTLPTSLVTPDGQVIANITYPFIAQRIDDDLSIELRGAALPGASQDAVAGARP